MTKITSWTGNAQGISQQRRFLMAGTFLTGETITTTINNKSVITTLTEATPTLENVAGDIATDCTNSSITEFKEITWGSDTDETIAEGTEGEPFVATMATDSVSGTIDGGITSSGTDAITATGPNYIDNADNWDNGLPADGDTVVFANSAVDVLYNLDQHTITPATVYIDASFIGELGLALYHAGNGGQVSYLEYRSRYLRYCDSGDATNTKIYIGRGPGSGSQRINLDTGTGQVTMTVLLTATPASNELVSLFWKGTHASNSLSVLSGKVGVAYYAGELATVVSPTISFLNQVDSDSLVIFGNGTTITTSIIVNGGIVQSASAIATIQITGGTLVMNEAAAVATAMNIDGGTISWNSSGTIAVAKLGNGGKFDASKSVKTYTITTITLDSNSTYLDPLRLGTLTNPMILNRCSLADVTLDFGQHITLQKANGT